MRFHCKKAGMRHVTTLRVNHFFTRQNKPIAPRERGRIGSQVTLRQIWPRFCLTDEKPWPPTRTHHQFIEPLALNLYKNRPRNHCAASS